MLSLLLFVPHLRWTALVTTGHELKLSQQSSLSPMSSPLSALLPARCSATLQRAQRHRTYHFAVCSALTLDRTDINLTRTETIPAELALDYGFPPLSALLPTRCSATLQRAQRHRDYHFAVCSALTLDRTGISWTRTETIQQNSLSTMAFTTVGALACSLFRYTSAGTTASGLHKLCWAQQSSRSTMALRHCRHSCFPVVPQYFSWHTSSGPPLNCTRRSKLAIKPLSRATRARSHSPALLASRRASCESTLTAQASLRVVIRAQ